MDKKTPVQSIIKNTQIILNQIKNHDDNFLLGLKDMFIITTSYRGLLKKAFSHLLDSPELIFKSLLTGLEKRDTSHHNRQFRHKTWQTKPFYYYKKSFEHLNENLVNLIIALPHLSTFERQQALFFTRVFLEFIAPYNHLIFHPQLLALTKEKKGENLLQGLANFLSDVTIWQGYFAISRSPIKAFTPGIDVACSTGTVIQKTNLYELLCFPAQTTNKQGTPLLLVTSWINKYYILDLKKRNSFIHWLTEQGFHVYTISWNMPDKSFKDYDFSYYVEHGVLNAFEQIYQYYQHPLHLAGYCLGGTLLAAAVAYLEKVVPNKVKSLSLFASMIDFNQAGTMKYLLGDAQIAAFEQSMQTANYWHGRKMAAAFCLSDAENTYWPFYTRNYLQGESSISHELIYWAQDYTHSPQALFSYYMRGLYRDNLLVKKNAVIIHQQPVTISTISCPVYCLGLQEDNLTPAPAAFDTAKLFTNCQFILNDGTHVSGMLSTIKQTKLGYYHSELSNIPTLKEWKARAQYKKGSWWLKGTRLYTFSTSII